MLMQPSYPAPMAMGRPGQTDLPRFVSDSACRKFLQRCPAALGGTTHCNNSPYSNTCQDAASIRPACAFVFRRLRTETLSENFTFHPLSIYVGGQGLADRSG